MRTIDEYINQNVKKWIKAASNKKEMAATQRVNNSVKPSDVKWVWISQLNPSCK